MNYECNRGRSLSHLLLTWLTVHILMSAPFSAEARNEIITAYHRASVGKCTTRIFSFIFCGRIIINISQPGKRTAAIRWGSSFFCYDRPKRRKKSSHPTHRLACPTFSLAAAVPWMQLESLKPQKFPAKVDLRATELATAFGGFGGRAGQVEWPEPLLQKIPKYSQISTSTAADVHQHLTTLVPVTYSFSWCCELCIAGATENSQSLSVPSKYDEQQPLGEEEKGWRGRYLIEEGTF